MGLTNWLAKKKGTKESLQYKRSTRWSCTHVGVAWKQRMLFCFWKEDLLQKIVKTDGLHFLTTRLFRKCWLESHPEGWWAKTSIESTYIQDQQAWSRSNFMGTEDLLWFGSTIAPEHDSYQCSPCPNGTVYWPKIDGKQPINRGKPCKIPNQRILPQPMIILQIKSSNINNILTC